MFDTTIGDPRLYVALVEIVLLIYFLYINESGFVGTCT